MSSALKRSTSLKWKRAAFRHVTRGPNNYQKMTKLIQGFQGCTAVPRSPLSKDPGFNTKQRAREYWIPQELTVLYQDVVAIQNEYRLEFCGTRVLGLNCLRIVVVLLLIPLISYHHKREVNTRNIQELLREVNNGTKFKPGRKISLWSRGVFFQIKLLIHCTITIVGTDRFKPWVVKAFPPKSSGKFLPVRCPRVPQAAAVLPVISYKLWLGYRTIVRIPTTGIP